MPTIYHLKNDVGDNRNQYLQEGTVVVDSDLDGDC